MTRGMAWAAIGLVVLTAGPAEAAAHRAAPTVTIGQAETVGDDCYVAGAQVEVDGHVTGDLYVAGGLVTVRGRIDGDLVVAGGSVSIDGPVGGAVRAAGSQVRLAAPVGGDLLVAAGQIETRPPTRVGGESLLTATDQTLMGDLGRSLHTRGENLVLDGAVHGDAHVTSPRLVVGHEARIDGALQAETLTNAPLEPGAVVLGGVISNPLASHSAWSAFLPWLLRWVTAWLVGLLTLYTVPHSATVISRTAMRHPHWRILLGLGVLFGAPMLAIMGMLTVIALPLGLMLLAAYLAGLYLAQLVVAWGVARWALERLGDAETHWKQALALGAALAGLFALKALPIAGLYLNFAIVIWGLGAMALVLQRWWIGHESVTGTPQEAGST